MHTLGCTQSSCFFVNVAELHFSNYIKALGVFVIGRHLTVYLHIKHNNFGSMVFLMYFSFQLEHSFPTLK